MTYSNPSRVNPSWLFSVTTLAFPSLRAITRRTLCNCIPRLRGKWTYQCFCLQVFNFFTWTRCGGVWTTPVKPYTLLSLFLSFFFFFSFDPLFLDVHRRSSTCRSRLGPSTTCRRVVYATIKEGTNKHSKGGNVCAADKTKRRGAAKFV